MKMECRCLAVGAVSAVVPFILYMNVDVNTITGFALVLFASLVSVAVFVWVLGLDQNMRAFLIGWVKDKLGKSDYN